MKNKEIKGISLIVLIITIIVIIILAGVVIISLVNNNPIHEASEAKYKQDLKSLNERAQTSLLKQAVSDSNILNKTITDKEQIYLYIPELKGTAYQDKVYIANGEIILKGAMLTKEEIKWAKEIHIKIDNLPVIDKLTLTSTETEVTANVTIIENPEVVGYRYRIQGLGGSNEWVDKTEPTHVFTGLKPGEEYVVEVVAYTNHAESMVARGVITTAGVSEIAQIEIAPTTWTKDDVTVTVTHVNKPAGYTIQYKVDTKEWQDYTAPFMQSENASIKARIYNKVLTDEIGANSKEITNIDKTVPTIPTEVTIVSTGYNSITVQAEGSTDVGSGLVGYEYSTDGTNYSAVTTENYVINNVKAGASITVYARAKDGVGLMSAVKNITTTTTGVEEQVSIIPNTTAWASSVTITLSHTNIPSGYVVQYKQGTGAWANYSTPFSVANNMKITARLYLSSINDEIAVANLDITNIDTTLPAGTFGAVVNTNELPFTPSDLESGVGNNSWRYQISLDGGATYGAFKGIDTGYQESANYTLNQGVSVPVLMGSGLKLSINEKYELNYEYISSGGNNTFNIDLWPDSLPEIWPIATSSWQTGKWEIFSSSNDMQNCMLRIFNDKIIPNPTTISLRNIVLYAKGRHSIVLPAKPNVKVRVEVTDNVGNKKIVESAIINVATTAVSIVPSRTDWTNQAVAITLNYSSIPNGYQMQYKIGDGSWVSYTSAFSVTSNTKVTARLYHAGMNDEIGSSQINISNIDTLGPTVTNVTTSKTHNSITANASASDGGIGTIAGYQYYCTNTNVWGTTEGASKTFTGLSPETLYHVYVRAVDTLGNVGSQVGPYAVTTDKIPDFDANKGGNRPLLAQGMTPIKWVNNTVTKTIESDPDWYNYNNKQWANAISADGSMWVWIPRYIYKIPTEYWHRTSYEATTQIQFSNGINDDWNSVTIGLINRGTTSNSSNGMWTNHPAFTFGSKELTGIWVAKFEASTIEGGNDNTTAKTVQIKPGVINWKGMDIQVIFNVCRQMENKAGYGWQTNGIGIDVHQMKNVEWGAVAYLAHSIYGINKTRIEINQNSLFYTGGGPDNAYLTNIGQSTTANVYGIYDMSGGSHERVANASIDYNLDNKYFDGYGKIYYDYLIDYKGDAMYETSSVDGNTSSSSWYGGQSTITQGPNYTFTRGGGNYDGGYYSRGIFAFRTETGSMSGGSASFRPIIAVADGI